MSEAIEQAKGKNARAALNYAGQFERRGRLDTVNPEKTYLAFDPHEMLIRDARPVRNDFNLTRHGFEFAQHRSETARDPNLFAETSAFQGLLPSGLIAKYSEELIDYIQWHTNAKLVIPQVSSFLARASNRSKKKTWAGTAGLVHLDYTPKSAQQMVDWTLGAHEMQAPRHRYFAFIQTWRALSPGPQDNSLCVCDGSSVAEDGAVVVDAVMGPVEIPAKCFEFRLGRFGTGHKWYYLSDMAPDDVLLFKGYDSRFPRAMMAMHSAFDNPLAGPEAPPRHSIEARFLAYYD